MAKCNNFQIKPSGDYFNVTCDECTRPCQIEFTKYDGTTAWIKITCSCGSIGPFKVNTSLTSRFIKDMQGLNP
jgi:hypothetical protein